MRCMLDLETLGKAAGCCVVSIGAVAFDEQGAKVGSAFSAFLNLPQQQAKGLSINAETVMWWLTKDKLAQDSLVSGNAETAKNSVRLELYNFAHWYRENGCEEIWGNGADFDIPILGAVYDAFGVSRPWAYNAGRCCRTIFKLIHRRMGDFGTTNALAHDAVQDAIYQAQEAAAALRWLRGEQVKAVKAET